MKKSKTKNKRVLFIDALNSYYRAYIVDPSLSTNGDPIGGMKGFLKILQKLSREIRPGLSDAKALIKTTKKAAAPSG